MRIRRTNKQVESDIFDAVTTLSRSVDLTDITMTMVAKASRMDMKVLKRRYSDMKELLDAYVSRFDKCLSTLIKSGDHIADKAERYGYLFGKYLEGISQNEQVRLILLWELDDTNDLGFIAGQKRDIHLVELLSEDFPPCPKGSEKELVREQVIVYLAGMTYLYLNRSDAAFMGIKHFSEEGKKSLQDGLVKLLRTYFSL